jgi:hypothetical protein
MITRRFEADGDNLAWSSIWHARGGFRTLSARDRPRYLGRCAARSEKHHASAAAALACLRAAAWTSDPACPGCGAAFFMPLRRTGTSRHTNMKCKTPAAMPGFLFGQAARPDGRHNATSAGLLCSDAEGGTSPLLGISLLCTVLPRYTFVCIDNLKIILGESRKPNRQSCLLSTKSYGSGLNQGSSKI